ncbi:MAG: family 16 glycosylhydrolase [Ruminiclostridium sp.]|nr:family 16 glycosylhydrolase [Ruminiclostridium sp.]
MTTKYTKLIFENTFTKDKDLENWEIKEYNEIFKGKEPVTDIIPTHVDDGEKEPTVGGTVSYVAKNVYIKDNNLCLAATNDENGYYGAMMSLKDKKFGKGYLEVKAKFPPFSNGVWPKMSLVNKDGFITTENDFAQIMGIRGKNACTLLATFYDGDVYKSVNYLYSVNNAWPRFYPDAMSSELLSEGYHIFACEQTETDLAFYVDGIEFSRIDIACPVFAPFNCDGTLNLSIAVGMPKIEAPDETTIAPCEMQVEYIRFYGEE